MNSLPYPLPFRAISIFATLAIFACSGCVSTPLRQTELKGVQRVAVTCDGESGVLAGDIHAAEAAFREGLKNRGYPLDATSEPANWPTNVTHVFVLNVTQSATEKMNASGTKHYLNVMIYSKVLVRSSQPEEEVDHKHLPGESTGKSRYLLQGLVQDVAYRLALTYPPYSQVSGP